MAYCFALSLALKQRLDVTRKWPIYCSSCFFAGEIGTASGRSIGAITHWNYRSISRGSQSLLERLNELGNYSEYPRARYKTLKSWIYENHIWELRGEGIIEDHRSYRHNFCSCEKKAWIVRDSNPWPLRYRCSALPINAFFGMISMNILSLALSLWGSGRNSLVYMNIDVVFWYFHFDLG